MRHDHTWRPGGHRRGGTRGRRGKRAAGSNFTRPLALACLVVAITAWNAAPQLRSGWTIATTPAEQVGAVEQSAYYYNCDEARAAGTAPIYRGEPGYRDKLDGDSDGIACEPYPH